MSQSTPVTENNRVGFLVDLTLYLTVMFAIREVYFDKFNFITNGLFWSATTLVVATWRMRARGVSWRELGLRTPDNLLKTLGISLIILAATVVTMIVFEVAKDALPFELKPDTSAEGSKFGELKGNYPLFFSIIVFVWLESMLEEMLDRGFLLSWLEKLFSRSNLATAFAVVLQACIFGFRHSFDLSSRSVSVGLIGLVMGVAYVIFGRNLWSLIIAHSALNTISMLDRV